jgi:hypothetical protein
MAFLADNKDLGKQMLETFIEPKGLRIAPAGT